MIFAEKPVVALLKLNLQEALLYWLLRPACSYYINRQQTYMQKRRESS